MIITTLTENYATEQIHGVDENKIKHKYDKGFLIFNL